MSEKTPGHSKGTPIKPSDLKKHVIFLDVQGYSNSSNLEKYLTQLGAKIDKFLSKDVTCVVTNRKETKSDTSLAGEDGIYMSRSQIMLNKSKEVNKNSKSLNPVERAKKLGIRICKLSEILKLINSTGLNKRSSSSDSVRFQHLTDCFIKIDDSNSGLKPVYQKLSGMPTVELTRSGSPFLTTEDEKEEKGSDKKSDVSKETKTLSKDSISTTSTKSKSTKKERKASKKKENTYCECCNTVFTNLEEHLKSNVHRAYLNSKSNFTNLEETLGEIPTVERLVEESQSKRVKTKGAMKFMQNPQILAELNDVSEKSEEKQSKRKNIVVTEKNGELFSSEIRATVIKCSPAKEGKSPPPTSREYEKRSSSCESKKQTEKKNQKSDSSSSKQKEKKEDNKIKERKKSDRSQGGKEKSSQESESDRKSNPKAQNVLRRVIDDDSLISAILNEKASENCSIWRRPTTKVNYKSSDNFDWPDKIEKKPKKSPVNDSKARKKSKTKESDKKDKIQRSTPPFNKTADNSKSSSKSTKKNKQSTENDKEISIKKKTKSKLDSSSEIEKSPKKKPKQKRIRITSSSSSSEAENEEEKVQEKAADAKISYIWDDYNSSESDDSDSDWSEAEKKKSKAKKKSKRHPPASKKDKVVPASSPRSKRDNSEADAFLRRKELMANQPKKKSKGKNLANYEKYVKKVEEEEKNSKKKKEPAKTEVSLPTPMKNCSLQFDSSDDEAPKIDMNTLLNFDKDSSPSNSPAFLDHSPLIPDDAYLNDVLNHLGSIEDNNETPSETPISSVPPATPSSQRVPQQTPNYVPSTPAECDQPMSVETFCAPSVYASQTPDYAATPYSVPPGSVAQPPSIPMQDPMTPCPIGSKSHVTNADFEETLEMLDNFQRKENVTALTVEQQEILNSSLNFLNEPLDGTGQITNNEQEFHDLELVLEGLSHSNAPPTTSLREESIEKILCLNEQKKEIVEVSKQTSDTLHSESTDISDDEHEFNLASEHNRRSSRHATPSPSSIDEGNEEEEEVKEVKKLSETNEPANASCVVEKIDKDEEKSNEKEEEIKHEAPTIDLAKVAEEVGINETHEGQNTSVQRLNQTSNFSMQEVLNMPPNQQSAFEPPLSHPSVQFFPIQAGPNLRTLPQNFLPNQPLIQPNFNYQLNLLQKPPELVNQIQRPPPTVVTAPIAPPAVTSFNEQLSVAHSLSHHGHALPHYDLRPGLPIKQVPFDSMKIDLNAHMMQQSTVVQNLMRQQNIMPKPPKKAAVSAVDKKRLAVENLKSGEDNAGDNGKYSTIDEGICQQLDLGVFGNETLGIQREPERPYSPLKMPVESPKTRTPVTGPIYSPVTPAEPSPKPPLKTSNNSPANKSDEKSETQIETQKKISEIEETEKSPPPPRPSSPILPSPSDPSTSITPSVPAPVPQPIPSVTPVVNSPTVPAIVPATIAETEQKSDVTTPSKRGGLDSIISKIEATNVKRKETPLTPKADSKIATDNNLPSSHKRKASTPQRRKSCHETLSGNQFTFPKYFIPPSPEPPPKPSASSEICKPLKKRHLQLAEYFEQTETKEEIVEKEKPESKIERRQTRSSTRLQTEAVKEKEKTKPKSSEKSTNVKKKDKDEKQKSQSTAKKIPPPIPTESSNEDVLVKVTVASANKLKIKRFVKKPKICSSNNESSSPTKPNKAEQKEDIYDFDKQSDVIETIAVKGQQTPQPLAMPKLKIKRINSDTPEGSADDYEIEKNDVEIPEKFEKIAGKRKRHKEHKKKKKRRKSTEPQSILETTEGIKLTIKTVKPPEEVQEPTVENHLGNGIKLKIKLPKNGEHSGSEGVERRSKKHRKRRPYEDDDDQTSIEKKHKLDYIRSIL